jgi:formylaminopyrimidine deformylase / aminopyrimidine aminohydrolase
VPLFTDRLVEANRAVWAAMAAHPFVLGLAHGRLPAPALRAWVQQDRVFVLEERRVVAALRAHRLPSRLDDLLADLDRSLVQEAEAFTRTAAEHGVALDAEPWPVCLGYTSYLLCAAYDGALEGLTALYAAERAYLDTWTTVAKLSPADSTYHAWIQNWSGEAFRGFVSALGRGLDELAGAPSPTLAHRLGVVFTGAARFELAFWEMCWSGQAWPA